MPWWFILQAVAGVAAIVWLIDAGMDKDNPILMKLAFAAAFLATWGLSKALDLVVWFQERGDRS